MTLPGPSRTIVVQPVEEPAPERAPAAPEREAEPEPAPEREPEPAPEREREPVDVP